MFPYHNQIKSWIKVGMLVSYKYVDDYKFSDGVAKALLLTFDNGKVKPIREHRFPEYREILGTTPGGAPEALQTYLKCSLVKMYPWIDFEFSGCMGLDDPDEGLYDRCDNCPVFTENMEDKMMKGMINVEASVGYYGKLPVIRVAEQCKKNGDVLIVHDGIPTWLGKERSQDESKK